MGFADLALDGLPAGRTLWMGRPERVAKTR
jgi:hypothetical protein